MLEIKPSIAQGWGKGELYPILRQLQNLSVGIGGEVYFVEGNTGSDSGDIDKGKSWETAYKTIAYAIGVSNTYISAKHYASRNTIFIRGTFTETLATAPEKCDLVGVGSSNARPRPRITGSQVMTNTAWGTRFINLEFRGDAAGINMVWTAGGFEIHNCVFSHAGIYTGTHAITMLNPTDVIIQGCEFEMRNEAFFSTACIAITSSALINRCRIIDCGIRGAVGVVMGVGSDDHFYDCSIEDCYIYSSGLCVNDVTGNQGWALINNRVVTQAANTTNDMLVYNVALAAGNIATGATNTNTAPVLVS
jgi:hypothetical protein